MDGARYLKLKEKDAVRIMRIGKGDFAMGVRKFDPTSGVELEGELVRIKREEVEAAKKTFEEGVASLNALLADMDADETAPKKSEKT